MSEYDPDGGRLPIKVDSTTNGEYCPRPLPKINQVANKVALETAGNIAKSLSMKRRDFLISTCGAAATLAAFNQVHAAAGATGGTFEIPKPALWESQVADYMFKGDDFIFDIQGHHVSPISKWRNPKALWTQVLAYLPRAQCKMPEELGDFGHLDCLNRDVFIKELFLDSDTSMGVLSFVPTKVDDMPLSTEEAFITKSIVDALDGTERLFVHGRVIPNVDGDIERMFELKDQYKIAAWKTYTQYGNGWWLDDEYGEKFLDAVRRTGIKLVCVHKGIPLPGMGHDLTYSRCDDIGRAARKNPDITFIVYHSGFDPDIQEGPFELGSGKGGVDSLIQSLVENDIKPNSNVYAELGSTWRDAMKFPDQAAHLMGKLIKYVGENNVVWGTDSIWYGSPQDQIYAFKAFQISDEFCERYGYAKLTPEVKKKILGLNAAVPYGVTPSLFQKKAKKDVISRARQAYAEAPNPSFQTYGPRTRAEFLRFWKMGGHG